MAYATSFCPLADGFDCDLRERFDSCPQSCIADVVTVHGRGRCRTGSRVLGRNATRGLLYVRPIDSEKTMTNQGRRFLILDRRQLRRVRCGTELRVQRRSGFPADMYSSASLAFFGEAQHTIPGRMDQLPIVIPTTLDKEVRLGA